MARRYRFHHVDVFTDRAFAGNPLVVFPEGDDLSDVEMQRIAQETNLSETCFVQRPTPAGEAAAATYRLRIFAPTFEMPFAGHPSVGAAWVLAHEGRFPLKEPLTQVRMEVVIGVLPLDIEVAGGQPRTVTLTQGRPQLGPTLDEAQVASVAEALGVPADALGWETPDGRRVDPPMAGPRVVSTGVPYLVVPFRRREAMSAVPSTQGIAAADLVRGLGAEAPLLVAPGNAGAVPDAAVHARLLDVSVGAGFIEDPATGSAAGPLAVHVARMNGATRGTFRVVIEQGVEVGRPSRLVAEVDHDAAGEPVAARVSGGVAPVFEGVLTLPG